MSQAPIVTVALVREVGTEDSNWVLNGIYVGQDRLFISRRDGDNVEEPIEVNQDDYTIVAIVTQVYPA